MAASLSAATVFAWERDAACRNLPTQVFACLMANESPRDRERRVAAAKAVCAQCPVRSDCLDYALRVCEPLGIWGGLDESERRALDRRLE